MDKFVEIYEFKEENFAMVIACTDDVKLSSPNSIKTIFRKKDRDIEVYTFSNYNSAIKHMAMRCMFCNISPSDINLHTLIVDDATLTYRIVHKDKSIAFNLVERNLNEVGANECPYEIINDDPVDTASAGIYLDEEAVRQLNNLDKNK